MANSALEKWRALIPDRSRLKITKVSSVRQSSDSRRRTTMKQTKKRTREKVIKKQKKNRFGEQSCEASDARECFVYSVSSIPKKMNSFKHSLRY